MYDISDFPARLEAILAERSGLEHLEVSKRGDSLTIYSESPHGTVKHARLTHLGAGVFGLSFMRHTGRWEKTPFTGELRELVEDALQNFGWHFAAMDNWDQTPDHEN